MGLLKATFNGVDLPIKITEVNRNLTPDISMKLLSIQGRNGDIFQDTRYGAKAIDVKYQIDNRIARDLSGFRRKMAGLLYYTEPKKLVFSDEPDLYYDAVVSGEQTLDENDYTSTGVIRFSVPDGVAQSITEKYAQNNGSSTITVENKGTESVPISFTATMKSDNGYFALVLDDRYYQIGNAEEVDGNYYDESVMLFDDHFNVDRGWAQNQGITPPVTPQIREQVGTIMYNQESENEGYAYVSTYAGGDMWHGASISKDINAGSDGRPVNWKATWRFDFNTDGASSPEAGVGHQSVTFSDEDDNIIVSVVFEDNNPSKNSSDMAVYIGQQRVWTVKNADEEFYVTGRGDNGPCVVVEKLGSVISVRFSYADINKSFEAENPDAKLKKITWYAAKYGDRVAVRNNFFRAMNLVRHNVDKWNDIPNYFSNGDVIDMEGETGKLYINDVYNTDVVDMGSKTLLLPPGIHTIGILKSSFAAIPEVKVSWKERWL